MVARYCPYCRTKQGTTSFHLAEEVEVAHHSTLVALGLVFASFSAACVSSDLEGGPLVVDRSDSAGVELVTLSHSLEDVGNGFVEAEVLVSDLTIGSVEDGFGHLTDITTFPDGRIAASDLMQKKVWIFDSDGIQLANVGRSGEGPGEFTDPIALATFGDFLVVHQTTSPRFTVFTADGELVATSPPNQLPDQDWAMFYFRGSFMGNDRPYQTTSEDWTRRLDRFDDSTFVFRTQPNERNAAWLGLSFPFDSPPTSWIRFNILGGVVDTVAVTTAPRSRHIATSFGTPSYDQPIYARRPIFASGMGWVATGHGRDSRVNVLWTGSSEQTIVRWPEVSRAVSADETIEAARWLQRNMSRFWPSADAFDEQWRGMSGRERTAWLGRNRDVLAFPDTVPQVVAVYGAGSCLWLGGFAARDYADGTSLTWVVIDLEKKEADRVVRIPRRGSRVRHVDQTVIFASYRDDDGVHFLERYPVPGLEC